MNDIVIIAGGEAKRLGKLTADKPKSLIDINGKPFLYYQLRLLESNGFEHVILCVGKFGNQIEEYVKALDTPLKIDVSYDGDKLRGTGGAVAHAYDFIGTDKFFVMYGDSYLLANYKWIETYFNEQDKLGLMTIYKNLNYNYTNNVIYQSGSIISYSKEHFSPEMQYMDYGLSMFEKDLFTPLGSTTFDLSYVFQSLIANNQLAVFELDGKFYEVGSFEGIEDFKRYLG